MTYRIIDGHRHLMCADAHSAANQIDPMKANSLAGVSEASVMVNMEKAPTWVRKMTEFDEHINDMTDAGIDMGVIWPPPLGYYYWTEPSAGADLARTVNEYTAGIVRSHKDRLLGLAVVPLQNGNLAAKELAHAVGNLGLSGVAICSNVNGHNLDEEDFLPFFEQAEQLNAPIFIHPDDPAGSARMRDYYLTNFVGYPMDTTLAACHLAFGGALDRYPNLKVCLVHAGGALPFLLGRLEHGQSVRPEAREKCKHPFPYYLRNFYVDTVAFRPEILRFVLKMMPEGHVFMGTDYPFDMADPNPVASVKKAILDNETLAGQILGGNLSRLLRVSEDISI